MRTLVWIAVGFTAACAAGVYAAPGMWLLPLAVFCTAALLGVACFQSKAARTTSIVLLGCLAGIVWMWLFHMLYLDSALERDAQVQKIQVELSDYTYASDYGSSVDGWITLDGKPYKVKLYLKEEIALKPGDQVKGTFLLRYTADGGERSPTYHQGKGIFLLAYAREKCEFTCAESIPFRYFPAVLANEISQMLERIFPEDTLPFSLALLLGDDRLLDYETDKALQLSGIRHIIAVSGLHISILFSLIYSLCGKRRVLTALIGIPILLVFASAAGFTPSIVRACIMQCIMILAMLVNREYDPPTALSFAVLVILAVNPLAVTSVSFQLSAGCMAGIFLFVKPMEHFFTSRKWFGSSAGKSLKIRIKRWCVTSVSVTISAMTLTTPLCAYYFNAISLIGIVTNLLTLWVISFIFYGIILACILGVVYLPVGQGIAWIVSWPIRYVLMISDVLSKLPISAVFTGSVYIIAWLVFCYILFMVFLRHRKKHPALFAGCLILGLCAAIAFTFLENPKEGLAVTVIDVGQGQCVLLQSDEVSYLVDCGNTYGDDAADTVIGQLWTRGIFSLDGVILTHYDKDHAGGINALVSWVPTDALYLPDTTPDNELRQQIVEENEDCITWVTEVSQLQLNPGTITIYPSEETDDTNESSLCILFQVENYDILITGDRSIEGEEALLQMADLPRLELLVVGHHGSGSSTGLGLLEKTQPVTAVISVGEDNSYGHPAQETLERLELFGCQVLRTDQEGTITFRG